MQYSDCWHVQCQNLGFTMFKQEGVQTNTTAIFGSAACAVTAYSLARQALIAHRGVFEMLVLLSTLWPELLTSYDSQKAIYHVWQEHLKRARFLEIYGVNNEIVQELFIKIYKYIYIYIYIYLYMYKYLHRFKVIWTVSAIMTIAHRALHKIHICTYINIYCLMRQISFSRSCAYLYQWVLCITL